MSAEEEKRNVEIKARVKDPKALNEKARQLANASEPTVLEQKDSFYVAPKGSRLKLRLESNRKPHLVWYQRPDEEGPKLSRYRLCALENDESAKSLDLLLSDCFGRAGVLSKTRNLYIVDQTRIHVDEVDGLGHFMELEVVLQPNQTVEEGQRIADDIMEKLGISQDDLMTGSYMDALNKLQQAS